MPPLPDHLLLMLLLLLAASGCAASFTCLKPATCQSAVIGYDVPYATTYEELISRLSPTTLRDLVAANQLPPYTATKQAIPAKTTLTIPFTCRCTGNGMGQSNLYTARNKFDDGSMSHQQEIVSANHIADIAAGQKLWIPLPCSCDKVDGTNVTRFAYVVRSGENSLEISGKYGVPESTLLRTNNMTNCTILRQGQILDIPLQEDLAHAGQIASENLHAPPHISAEVVRGILIAILIAAILSIFFCTFYYWRSAYKSLSSWTNGNMQFDYGDLSFATHRFSKESMIAEGNFGTVYKATINGQEVAVKKLKANGTTKEVHRELKTISKTKHPNLVSLKGWCGRIRLIDARSCWKWDIPIELHLVFEWIPNGSLGDHLRNDEKVLPWDKRYNIVKGIGSALHYLHHGCNPCILHRDIKPDNILLDDHFNAKLADFGLSIITRKNGSTVATYAKGSSEYMDPQYQTNDRFNFNRKLDIYSFGLVLLEIACTGKKDEVRKMYGGSAQLVQVDCVADHRLHVFNRMEMERVVVLGLKCTQPEETQRPSMEDVIKYLENGEELLATTEGETGYRASCAINEEAPMMLHDAVPSC